MADVIVYAEGQKNAHIGFVGDDWHRQDVIAYSVTIGRPTGTEILSGSVVLPPTNLSDDSVHSAQSVGAEFATQFNADPANANARAAHVDGDSREIWFRTEPGYRVTAHTASI